MTLTSVESNISSSANVTGNYPGITVDLVEAGAGIADKVLPPLLATATLKDNYFVLPHTDDGKARIFIDKKLPASEIKPLENISFPTSYFVSLHEQVAASGPTYPAGTPNHLGARIPLQHCKLKVDRWRYHLRGYEGVDICQMIEFGFP